MYTIDASVQVSALNPGDPEAASCRAFLALVRERRLPLYSPTLMLVEVAAAVASALGDARHTLALLVVLRDQPNLTLVSLDEALAARAAVLAATVRLRGAGAVYGAVAREYGTTLVTLDRLQLERLSPLVKTARPADVLRALSEGAGA